MAEAGEEEEDLTFVDGELSGESREPSEGCVTRLIVEILKEYWT